MNTDDAAASLGKTAHWVRRQCAAGELRASRFGGSWFITPDAIAAYLDAHSNTPRPVVTRHRRRRSA